MVIKDTSQLQNIESKLNIKSNVFLTKTLTSNLNFNFLDILNKSLQNNAVNIENNSKTKYDNFKVNTKANNQTDFYKDDTPKSTSIDKDISQTSNINQNHQNDNKINQQRYNDENIHKPNNEDSNLDNNKEQVKSFDNNKDTKPVNNKSDQSTQKKSEKPENNNNQIKNDDKLKSDNKTDNIKNKKVDNKKTDTVDIKNIKVKDEINLETDKIKLEQDKNNSKKISDDDKKDVKGNVIIDGKPSEKSTEDDNTKQVKNNELDIKDVINDSVNSNKKNNSNTDTKVKVKTDNADKINVNRKIDDKNIEKNFDKKNIDNSDKKVKIFVDKKEVSKDPVVLNKIKKYVDNNNNDVKKEINSVLEKSNVEVKVDKEVLESKESKVKVITEKPEFNTEKEIDINNNDKYNNKRYYNRKKTDSENEILKSTKNIEIKKSDSEHDIKLSKYDLERVSKQKNNDEDNIVRLKRNNDMTELKNDDGLLKQKLTSIVSKKGVSEKSVINEHDIENKYIKFRHQKGHFGRSQNNTNKIEISSKNMDGSENKSGLKDSNQNILFQYSKKVLFRNTRNIQSTDGFAKNLNNSFNSNSNISDKNTISSVKKGDNTNRTFRQPVLNMSKSFLGDKIEKIQAAKELVEKTEILVKKGINTIKLKLKPGNLGKLEVKVEITEETLKAHFVTEKQEAKNHIEQNSVLIKRMFQESNNTVKDVQVDVELKDDTGSGTHMDSHANNQDNNSDEQNSYNNLNKKFQQSNNSSDNNIEQLKDNRNYNPFISKQIIDYIA